MREFSFFFMPDITQPVVYLSDIIPKGHNPPKDE